jgi:hypothetical protein
MRLKSGAARIACDTFFTHNLAQVSGAMVRHTTISRGEAQREKRVVIGLKVGRATALNMSRQ